MNICINISQIFGQVYVLFKKNIKRKNSLVVSSIGKKKLELKKKF